MEDLDALRDLLDAGVDVEDPVPEGLALLCHAIDVEANSATQSGTPLHVDITALLVARGADPVASMNALHVARHGGHWLVEELLTAWPRR